VDPERIKIILLATPFFSDSQPPTITSSSFLPTMAAILSTTLLLATSALAQHFIPTHVARQATTTSVVIVSPSVSPSVPAPSSAAPTSAPPPAAASAQPLYSYHFTYPDLPYQVNPFPATPGGRGPQTGYNICNSTTEGRNSLCQTAFVNSIDDFCLWGPPVAGTEIGNIEGEVVAYCSKPGHGTRVMAAGTLKSVQFMRTSAYIQVTGSLNQEGIGMSPTDYGGELDPHGADLLGNPLGGLVFSDNLPASRGVITQGENWSSFVGAGLFCIKVCDNTIRSPNYCQNIYDLIGCAYNMPSHAYETSDFTDCEGGLQMEPGLYVQGGTTLTWSQPRSLSPTNTMPWQPSVPASSSCTTYTSSKLYSQQTGRVGPTSTSRQSATGTATRSQSGSGAATATSTSGALANGVRVGALLAVLAAGFVVLA